MKETGKALSGQIEDILHLMEWCRQQYKEAQENMKEEDARLQDYLHAIEFAGDKNERNRLVTQLQGSRVRRRKSKDRILELESVIQFLDEPVHKKTFNNLAQLLGKQRKQEAYLNGERKYHNRVAEKQT